MTDKELDEAIALYYSGKLCNTGGKCNDVAWQAARELQSLRKGEHKDMVLVPRKLTDEMVVAFAEKWYSHRQAIDDPQMEDAYSAMIAAARKDGV